MRYNLQFEKLCALMGLGKPIAPPEPIGGGHLHRMFALVTDKGRYAVKALNPNVMRRPSAPQNVADSERIATVASMSVPGVPAIKREGSALQRVDGQYYLVFDWADGRTLGVGDIAPAHCGLIGGILARIHDIDFSVLGLLRADGADEPCPDWARYLDKGREVGAPWADLLGQSIGALYAFCGRLHAAEKALAGEAIVSHRDLEPKNVLWEENRPAIIDWEAAGPINPLHDLVETAVYWSKDGSGGISKDKFTAFIGAYMDVRGPIKADWELALDKGFSSILGWLEYSLKRSLLIECADEAEQRMGTEHVFNTIQAAFDYAAMIPELRDWLYAAARGVAL